MQKRIGLYGGTFNPVHFGHVNLALELKEKKDLSEVWVIPAHISPLRLEEKLVAPMHRLKMAKHAFEDIPGFKVLDNELRRPPPSFTIDTVDELASQNKEAEFFLLLGEDAIVRFLEWRGLDELIKRIPLLIGSRGAPLSLHSFPADIAFAIKLGLVVTRQLEISATDVRDRLKKRLFCGHLVPAKVLDYICENQLYFDA